MADFKMVFPCGHVLEVLNNSHVNAHRYGGKRPIELHVTGDLVEEGPGSAKWHLNIVHPTKGKVYYNGELVHE